MFRIKNTIYNLSHVATINKNVNIVTITFMSGTNERIVCQTEDKADALLEKIQNASKQSKIINFGDFAIHRDEILYIKRNGDNPIITLKFGEMTGTNLSFDAILKMIE